MLKIEHLKKEYPDFSLDCSLRVQSGMITGLIGRNGSGKSTTFKAILGLISRDGGKIELFGKPLEKVTAKDKQKLGVALADSGFSSYLNIRSIARILNSMYDSFEKEAFLQKCQEFDLPLEKKLKEFSTGMKAKLKVLVALSHHSSLLILDEPTVGLDVVAREEVLNMLRDYMEQHQDSAVLISSHISSDLETLCDELYLIHDGKIIFHEETDVLLGSYAVMKVPEKLYPKLDKEYLLKIRREPYGYCCLTDQKQFYLENYPGIVIENGNIDDLIAMMNGGESV